MRFMKSTTITAMALLLSLTATACGVKKDDTAAESNVANTQSGVQVKLRIMWWGSQARHDATLKALDLYTEKNPNVTFEPAYQGFDGYQDKISTQSAARNSPDIFQMDAAWLSDWAKSNRLADLASVNVEDIDSTLLETGKFDGKLVGLPLGNNAFGMVYNKTILDKLGLQAPETFDEFFRLTKEIKPKLAKDQYLTKDLTADELWYSVYQLSKGKGFPRTQDGKFNYDEDTWFEWMNTFADLRKGGYVSPPDVTVSDKVQDAQLDLLGQDKILIKNAHSAEFGAYDALKPGSLALTTLPGGIKASGWLKASMYWSVSPDSKNQEEAKKFLDWFINDQEAADILGTTRGTPVSKNIVEYLEPKFNATDKAGIELINKVAQDGNPFDPGPGNKDGWAKFSKEYDNITQQILFDKMAPAQAWEEIIKLSKEVEQN